jgi:protein arginine N-methyltransferase 1
VSGADSERYWDERARENAHYFVDNEVDKHRARPDQVLGDAVPWANLEYPTLTERGVRGGGTSAITKAGLGHGLLVWFDTELVDGIGYSNAPGAGDGIYGQILLPWPEAVALHAGDRVSFELRADPVGSDYVWTWTTEIQRPISGPGHATRFRQSTFKSIPPSPASVRARALPFAPSLSPEGTEVLEVLEGMRAGVTVGELARQLLAAHPARFPSFDHAHGFVAALAERYGS